MRAIRCEKIVCILLCAIAGSTSGFAQTEVRKSDDDKNLSPYFVVLSDENATAQLPLKSTSVDVNIAGVIADVNVKQVYTNTGKTTIEAIYVFPASTRSAVYDMVMKVNDREIRAVIEEKVKARNLYETAKKEGKTASLLEEDRPNVFKMNVANIIPGATVEVNLSYTELLIPTDNTYDFVYPTVVGPRYVSKGEMTAPKPETWTGNPYLKEGVQPTSKLDLKLKLTGGIPIKEMRCETHQCNINYTDKLTANLSLAESDGGNRDFIMQYRLTGNAIESGVLVYSEPGGENFFLAMMQPPKRVESEMIPPREYVFIVDVSGSMYGFPLDVSKQLMEDLLSSLKPTDLFNIVLFSGSASTLSDKSLTVSPENIARGIDYVTNHNGYGGTELLAALKTAMSLKSEENCSRSFVILTDGYVSVENEAFDYIKNNLGNANFFSFGIGSSVNRFIIEGMAHVGYGEPFIATNQSDATKMAGKFIKYISQPVLTNIQYSFNNAEVYDVLPDKIPDLFAERPLIISGKFKGAMAGTLTISGVSGNKKYLQDLQLNGGNANSVKALKYLWAREKVKLLCDYNNLRKDDNTKSLIVDLGKKYNLLTPYTSFVAIDSVISNKGAKSVTVKQPLPLPQGVSNNAVQEQSSQRLEGSSSTVTSAATAIGTVDFDSGTDDVEASVATSETIEEEVQEAFVIVEQMPEFPGGQGELLKYLSQNIVYPVSAQENGIQGTVYLKVWIDKDGKISKIKVLRSLNKACDEEAIRVVKAMPSWKPGRQGGRSVPVTYTLPIRFALQN